MRQCRSVVPAASIGQSGGRVKLKELRSSGHAPSLVAAFVHFDISFMVWVILGALMPFLASDPGLTGASLLVKPTAAASAAGPLTLIIKPSAPAEQLPKGAVHLLVKPGSPGAAARASVKPLESFVIELSHPATLDALNARSQLIRVYAAPGAHGNPNENIVPLKVSGVPPGYTVIANGYPASLKLALVGLPLLAAGFWRILLGILVDRFGSRRVGIASLFLTLLPLAIAWRAAGTYEALEFVGFFLGLAGASFAVSLPLASRWYPPHMQGIAMGIAGAGNSGTVIATLFAPILAKNYGWHSVFGILMIPVTLALIAYTLLAKDPPEHVMRRGFKEYVGVFGQADCWWMCLLYFVTFGGFVGMASFFNSFFVDQYDVSKTLVGLWTAPFIVAGSMLRPAGGWLADRLGGIRMLVALYSTVILCAGGVGLVMGSFPLTAALLLVMMCALGMGNGSVFQLVPQRFRKEIGVMTGFVGAAGGVGGYYLNFVLGHLKDSTGTYASGFFAFAAIAAVALTALLSVSARWTRDWLGRGGKARAAQVPPVRVTGVDRPSHTNGQPSGDQVHLPLRELG